MAALCVKLQTLVYLGKLHGNLLFGGVRGGEETLFFTVSWVGIWNHITYMDPMLVLGG